MAAASGRFDAGSAATESPAADSTDQVSRQSVRPCISSLGPHWSQFPPHLQETPDLLGSDVPAVSLDQPALTPSKQPPDTSTTDLEAELDLDIENMKIDDNIDTSVWSI